MAERGLLAGEYAVLALLWVRPQYGYEMARVFDQGALAVVCPIEQSMLYTYIRNVEHRGLVEWEEERVGNRPPRKIYTLTQSGRELAEQWLHEPVLRMREVRLELLVKLFCLGSVDPSAELDLVRRQIEVCEAYLSRLAARIAGLEGFERLVASSKLTAAESSIAWLTDHAHELEASGVWAGARTED